MSLRRSGWLVCVGVMAACSGTPPAGADGGAGGGGSAGGGAATGGGSSGGGGGGEVDAGTPPPTGAGVCPAQGPHGVCNSNADCTDFVFCTGVELCQDGACVAPSTAVCSSPQVCNESLQSCAQCATDADCSDGLFCNGVETCGGGTCHPAATGACPATRSCNETTDRCYGCTTGADCQDGLWCNGAETCVLGNCVSANPGLKPCAGRPCYEANHECGCSTSPQCDDGFFCTGVEVCDAGHCQNGVYPCPLSSSQNHGCDETTSSCTASTVTLCRTDLECSNTVFCDGAELCMPGARGADARGCLPSPGNPCLAGQTCNEPMQRCLAPPCPDADGDGHRAIWCGGDDCADDDSNRFPGNPEVCDAAHDEDCDALTFGSRDTDGDGVPSASCCDVEASGVRHCGADCDDGNASVHPGATEACNGVDDNCNHQIDEGLLVSMFHDGDGDGAGAASCARLVCPGTAQFVANGDDCDDTLAALRAGTQACGQGGDGSTIYVCDPGGVWRAAACPAGTRCVAQPNGTALCN